MHFRPATSHDTESVAAVLCAAATALHERGQGLWNLEHVSAAAVAPDVQAGLYHLGLEGDEAVGVFRLEYADPVFWPEETGDDAVYLHKLAVLPAWQGQGLASALLAHAVGLVRQRGRRFLRLDCRGGRPALRNVYERFGFRHHSDKVLGSQVFHRFELEVAA